MSEQVRGPIYGTKRLLAWMTDHPNARLNATGNAIIVLSVAANYWVARHGRAIYELAPSATTWSVFRFAISASVIASLAGIFAGIPLIAIGCLRIWRASHPRRLASNPRACPKTRSAR